MHFGGNRRGVVLEDAVSQLVTGEAALTVADLLFPQIHGFRLMPCRLCAFGKGCCQRFGIAALAGTGGNDQYLFIHNKPLLAFRFFLCYFHNSTCTWLSVKVRLEILGVLCVS